MKGPFDGGSDFVWVTPRPSSGLRVGLKGNPPFSILLMAEVLVGALSAALLAGEGLDAAVILGGGLILAAGLLEVWPQRPNGPD